MTLITAIGALVAELAPEWTYVAAYTMGVEEWLEGNTIPGRFMLLSIGSDSPEMKLQDGRVKRWRRSAMLYVGGRIETMEEAEKVDQMYKAIRRRLPGYTYEDVDGTCTIDVIEGDAPSGGLPIAQLAFQVIEPN